MKKRLLSSFWLEPLEPRLLFSADLVPPPPDGGFAGGEAVAVVETPLRPAGSATELSQTSEQLRRELVFIDGEVKDYQQLLDDFMTRQDGSRQIQAVVLDPDSDGIAQISAYLSTERDIDAIHLISHGSDGAVKLGNLWLTGQNLDSYAEAIEGWRLALSEDADLLLYGCDLAAGTSGQALVNSLALLTGADVAASSNPTGNSSLGGDWTLEYRSGAIETDVAFSIKLQQLWSGLLQEWQISDDFASGGYAGNTGNQNWTGAWTEINDDGLATGGSVQLVSGALQLTTVAKTEPLAKGVSRAADLTGAQSAYLSFDYSTIKGSGNGRAVLQISANGGATWDTLAVYKISGATAGSELLNISAYISANTQIRLVSQGVNGGGLSDGVDTFIADNIKIRYTTTAWNNPLWITTEANSTAGGLPGLALWAKSDLVQVADPNLIFEPVTTSGTFKVAAPLSSFANGKQINGIHYVSSALKVGSNNFQLLQGDILFVSSDANNTAFGGLIVDKADVVLFRPSTPGDYSAGTFSILFRDMVPGQEIRGITLVESETVVGGVTLNAGDFLFLRHGGTEEHQIWRYTNYTVGNAAGGGTDSLLIDGTDPQVNINKRLVGIDMVETTVTIGGRTLNAGTLLLAVDNGASVGNNNQAVDEFDIFALEFSPTDIGFATASLFFDGSKVGLKQKIDGFSLKVIVNVAPVLTPSAPSLTTITEDNTNNSGNLVSTILGTSASDANGDPLGIAVTGTTAGNGTWQYSTNGGSSWVTIGVVTDTSALLLRGSDRIRFVPDAKNADTATLTYRAWDQTSGTAGGRVTTSPGGTTTAFSTATDTATLTVTAVNDAPTGIALDNLSVDENNAGAVIGNLTTSDVDAGDSHSYIVDDLRFEVVAGQLKLRAGEFLNHETEPTVSLNVTSSDSGGLSVNQSFVITVGNVNENPVAGTDSLTTTQDTPLLINLATDLLPNDSDVDLLDSPSIVSFTQPTNGTVVDNFDGTWTYTPNPGFFGLDTLTYTLSDGNGGTAVGTVNVSVNEAANSAPVAGGYSFNSTEDQPLTLDLAIDMVGNDSDPDLDPTTITGFTQPGNGALVDNFDGTWTYTPAPNFNGSDSFQYTLSDGRGGSDVGTVTITIAAANDLPFITGTQSGQTVNDTGTMTPFSDVTIGDIDDPAEVLTVTVSLDAAAQGTLSNLNGFVDNFDGSYTFIGTGAAATTALRDLVFSPTQNRVAVGSTETTAFTIRVNDGWGPVTNSGTTVVVTSMNDAPTISGAAANQSVNDSATTPPFSTVIIGDVDFPDQLLTVTVSLNVAAKGTLSGLGFTPSGGGIYTFTGTASAATSAIQGLVFDPADNRVAPGNTDTTEFTITVADDFSSTTDNTTTVISTSINDAPTITGTVSGQAVNDNATITPFDTVTIGDVDNPAQDLEVVVSLDPAQGVLSNLNGFGDNLDGTYTFTGTAAEATDLLMGLVFEPTNNRLAAGVTETTNFTISVDDGSGAVMNNTATVDVSSINDAPSAIALDNLSVAENDAGAIIGNLSTSDVDAGDSHSYSVDDARFTVVGGQLKLVSGQSLDFESEPSVAVTVTSTDAGGLSTSQLFTISVTNVNETPVTVNDHLATLEDNALTISTLADLLGNDTDIDGDNLTLSSFTQPAHGTLVANGDGTLTYTPGPNFNGSDNFSYTVSDGQGGTATGTALILVTAVGDTPLVSNVSTNAGVQSRLIVIDRHAADGPEVTHFRISGITGGRLYLADGVTQVSNGDFITVAQGQAGLKFTPAAGSVANGSFQVEASENGLTVAAQSGVATSTIAVTAPNLPQDKPSEESKKAEGEDKDAGEQLLPGIPEVLERSESGGDGQPDFGLIHPKLSLQPTHSPTLPMPALAREESSGSLPGTGSKDVKALFDSAPGFLVGFKNALASLDISRLTPEAYHRVREMLDAMQNELEQQIRLEKTLVGSAIATSVGLSAGYVVWMLQGGSLLASVLSSIPAWQLTDPLSILAGKKNDDEEDDEDSLAGIIAEGSVDDANEDEAERND